MKNPIIILGSSRSDGNTQKLAAALSNGSIPIVDLSQLNISPYDYEHKNSGDDYFELMEKLRLYDPVILATPVYWYTMSAIMKIFIDRLSDLLSIRKELGRALAGKHIFVLASYGTSFPDGFEEPFRQTFSYLKMKYCGCFYHHAKHSIDGTVSSDLAKFREQFFLD